MADAQNKSKKATDWFLPLAIGGVAAGAGAYFAYCLYADGQKKDEYLLKPKHELQCSDPSPRFRNDFDNIQLIGSGSFGEVFRAMNKLTTTYYAVKKIPLEKLNRNVSPLEEVAALEKLEHEHIVRYFSAWCEGIVPNINLFIQMQYCSEGNLEEWLVKTDLPQREGKGKLIWNQLAAAVAYIHGKGIIHRDLKPQNIFFEAEDKIRVGDFGLATEDQESVTIAGTPIYMAPEMFNKSGYNYKVDIYSAGMILFELLHFLEQDKKQCLEELKNSKFPPEFVANYPQEHQLIKIMLSGEPADRPEATDCYLNE